MNHAITLEAQVEAGSGTLLLQTAIALHEHRVTPLCLQWLCPQGGGAAKLVVVAQGTKERLQRLAERLNDVPGVRTVTLAPGEEQLPLPGRMVASDS